MDRRPGGLGGLVPAGYPFSPDETRRFAAAFLRAGLFLEDFTLLLV
jgi:hypothetical protein